MDKYNMNNEIENKTKRKNNGVDAFLLSIISILGILFWYICLPASIYSIVRSVKSVKKTGSRLAKAAFILAIIGLTIHFILYTQYLLVMLVDY